jgi:hypothetical protein
MSSTPIGSILFNQYIFRDKRVILLVLVYMVVSESSKSKNLEIGLTKFEDIAKIFSSSNVIPFQTSTINVLLEKKKELVVFAFGVSREYDTFATDTSRCCNVWIH